MIVDEGYVILGDYRLASLLTQRFDDQRFDFGCRKAVDSSGLPLLSIVAGVGLVLAVFHRLHVKPYANVSILVRKDDGLGVSVTAAPLLF